MLSSQDSKHAPMANVSIFYVVATLLGSYQFKHIGQLDGPLLQLTHHTSERQSLKLTP